VHGSFESQNTSMCREESRPPAAGERAPTTACLAPLADTTS